jgi:hypothetical protein
VAVVASFVIFPNLLMYFGFAALDSRGLGSALVGNLDDLVKVLAVTAAYIVGYGAPALLISTFARRSGPAAGIYLAIMFGSAAFGSAFSNVNYPGARYGTLLSFLQHPEVVRAWVFGQSQNAAPIDAGFQPWVSLVVIVAVGVVTAILMHRRYRVEL